MMQLSVSVRANLLALLCSILALNAYAETEEDAWNLLQKTAVAGHVLSYHGIFVYENKDQHQAVQVKHVYDGRGEYSRNVTLDSKPRELFSQGRDLVIYAPHQEKIIIKKRHAENLFPTVLPVKLDRLKSSYSLHAAETDTIAGRSARLLLLIPKDDYRYSYKFWVDNEYGLLLKYEMIDAKHQSIETIVFNDIHLIENIGLDWFQPQINHKKSYEMEKEVPIVPDSKPSQHWTIDKLPAGYVKIDQIKVMAHHKSAPMTQVIFSDGLASVSLFIERLSDHAPPRIGTHETGHTNLYANAKNGYQITVVGEVPLAAVTKIGNAVHFTSQAKDKVK